MRRGSAEASCLEAEREPCICGQSPSQRCACLVESASRGFAASLSLHRKDRIENGVLGLHNDGLPMKLRGAALVQVTQAAQAPAMRARRLQQARSQTWFPVQATRPVAYTVPRSSPSLWSPRPACHPLAALHQTQAQRLQPSLGPEEPGATEQVGHPPWAPRGCS